MVGRRSRPKRSQRRTSLITQPGKPDLIEETNDSGFVTKVTNPTGKKGNAEVEKMFIRKGSSETRFEASDSKTGRIIKTSKGDVEVLARQTARDGYKVVKILD